MNCKFVKASLLVVSVSVLFLAGCGPQDITDADYDILNKEEQGEEGAAAPAAQAQGEQGGEQAAAPAAQGGEAGGCPVGGNCPTGDCENPPETDTHRRVQLPDQYRTEPVKVTRTEERQHATNVVEHHQTTHINQPHERHHLTREHFTTKNVFFPKEVFHPSTRRINSVVQTFSTENETMPVVREVAPLVDHGCAAPAPAPAPVVRPSVVVFRPVPVPVYPFYGRHLYHRYF